MTQTESEDLIRLYAQGGITWSALRDQGFDDYIEVLAGLASLGLRPPVASMNGPNVAARRRGRDLIRERLRPRA